MVGLRAYFFEKVHAGKGNVMQGITHSYLMKIGVNPYKALRDSNLTLAGHLGRFGTEGTIGEGKTAKMVLLPENPPKGISHSTGVKCLMLGDSCFTRAELDAVLEEVIRTNEE